MSLVLNGDTGVQGNSGAFVAGTAVASTSGTSIDFTSIPSWVKRVTVMFNGVSTSGTSSLLVQIGSGSFTSSGYNSNGSYTGAASGGANSTSGFISYNDNATAAAFGSMILTNVSGNSWSIMGILGRGATLASYTYLNAGGVTLGGTLDRVRITTVNGTDTFDAGSINILYE